MDNNFTFKLQATNLIPVCHATTLIGGITLNIDGHTKGLHDM